MPNVDDEGMEVLTETVRKREQEHHPMNQKSELLPLVISCAVQTALRKDVENRA